MFRIAHLTDPHVGPLPRPKLRYLLSKRITGYYNWHRGGRREAHDMELLAELVADMKAQDPDHIICTGDVCNIGLPSEWASSRIFMEGLGKPEDVTFVPGNHDAYVPGSLEGLLAELAPWTSGDGAPQAFPFLRRRGAIAIVGLSSAIPTLPFVATGRVGSKQSQAAEALLTDLCQALRGRHRPRRRGARAAWPQPCGLGSFPQRSARPRPGDRRPLGFSPRQHAHPQGGLSPLHDWARRDGLFPLSAIAGLAA
jgi:hypothetical protein